MLQKTRFIKHFDFWWGLLKSYCCNGLCSSSFGLKSIGIIRGEELAGKPLNPTLAKAQSLGMQLHFVSRHEYRLRDDANYLQQLQQQFPQTYIIPEGGSNELAVQGCQEILSQYDLDQYDVICCAVGTGGMISGLIERSAVHQKVLGFSALKGDFLQQAIRQWTKTKLVFDRCILLGRLCENLT